MAAFLSYICIRHCADPVVNVCRRTCAADWDFVLLKSYAGVCLEGAIIILACVIFSTYAAAPPVVNADAAPVAMVWSYVGELIFNMLILVGSVKAADHLVREMMGL